MNNLNLNNITEHIRKRRSVRSFDGRDLDEALKEQLLSYANSIANPFGIPVAFKYLYADRDGLSCPVVSGTDLYLGAKIKNLPDCFLAFGYSFEMLVLYAKSLGIGTVWIGGTMNRPAFEKAMTLGADEIMPCATPIGYEAEKMSVRENLMRKAVKADERMPFEELFFDGAFVQPLYKENAAKLAEVLESVRLAPSAVNRQPWRVLVTDGEVHFYLKRSKGMTHGDKLDMQMIDMGIALCHFALAAEESGINVKLVRKEPKIRPEQRMEYVASYTIL